MDKIISTRLRKKNEAVFNDINEGIKLARNFYENRNFLMSFDTYEKLLCIPESDKFGLLAEVYEKFKNLPYSDRYHIYQSRFFDFNIKPGDKVLDIGSGNVPFPLATHLADITLEDNSFGRAGVPFKFLENKPVYEINIEDMPFEDKEFDFIYCSHVLEHVNDPEKACKELMRVGKRGYIETPKHFKDLIFNTARISNHLWKVDYEDNTLKFVSYDENDLDGLDVDVFREMSLNPLSEREKSIYSLIHLRADLFNTMLLWENEFRVTVNNKIINRSFNKNLKINFVIIVLNGMPFLKSVIDSIYKFAHKIVIIEGSVENCRFAADENGSSVDGTVEYIEGFDDLENKIFFIQGIWEEKLHMQNKALEFIDNGYIWLIDSDEVYKDEDIIRTIEMLSTDDSITQMNFISNYNFWKGFDFYFTSPEFFKPIHHYRRIFKYKNGCYFLSHRPPTLFYPEDNTTSDKLNVIDGFQTYSLGINLYHYSYVFNNQVEQKIKLYNKYGWGNDWNLDLLNWYNNFFLAWTPENRKELEENYPVWTGSKDSYTVRFLGQHPEVIKKLINELHSDDDNMSEEYLQYWTDDFNSRSVDIPDQYIVAEVIGDIKYQRKVLEAWSYIQTDQPIQKRIKWIRFNIQNNLPFWNIHVALSYTALKLKPKTYLEVGVRIGGSMVQVLNSCTPDSVTAVDIWSGEYASLPNNIEFTQEQINKFLLANKRKLNIEYIHGNSHDVLKQLIHENRKYELITIDGDHTLEGAEEDLEDAIKLLTDSGVIIFDDITHPSHKYLLDLTIKFAQIHNLKVILNTHQDNGCAIFLRGINIWDFLKEPMEEEKKMLKIAEEVSRGDDLTQISGESEFSKALTNLIIQQKPKKLVETGTYLGKGTTKIIASALKYLNYDSTFYSIEVNPKNYESAVQNIFAENLTQFVKLLNGLSVPVSLLPDKLQIQQETIESVEYGDVFVDHPENERVQKYFDETNFPGLPEDLLGKCLSDFNYKPDLILLDSGGHMGFVEFNYILDKIKSECIIALDDVYHIKHHKSYLFMKKDPRFEIIIESKEKFGFCIAKFIPVNEEIKFEGGYKKEKVKCLACNSKLSYPVRGDDIVKCISCGFVYLNERLTTSEMERYYREVYAVNDPFAASTVRVPKSIAEIETHKDYIGALREDLFKEAVKYYNKKIKNKTFIDIGCGWGGLLYNAHKNGMNVIGFEFTQPNVEFARNLLGFDVRQEQFNKSNIPENSADIITMSHVLEHVPDPVGFVKKIYDSLKDGGIYYCVVPNFNSLCSSIEKENWQWLERDWHYSQFTPDVLKDILEKAGFTIEKIVTVSGDYGSDAPLLALKKLNGEQSTSEKLNQALADINEAGMGEEIRIIAKKVTKKKRSFNKKNLLWVRTDSIGDAIISVNMLEQFAINLPDYFVTVVCQDHLKELYESAPFVDNILTFNRKKLLDDKHYKSEIVNKIKNINADLLINSLYSRDIVTDFITRESSAKFKIGIDGDLSNMTSDEMKKSRKLYDHLVQISPGLNEIEKNKTFLQYFSINNEVYAPKLFLGKEDKKFAEDFFTQNELNPDTTIAFFAGAQFNIRYYYHYGKALDLSLKDSNYTVVALGGKSDEYINELNLKDFNGKIIDLTGKTTFKQSAAILGNCKLAIGSETSLSHAACALNVPNVIILGGGHFGRFMPYSDLTTIVSLPLDCFNCNWSCKYNDVYCIKMIKYQTLAEAIKSRLSNENNFSKIYFQKNYEFDWLDGKPKCVEPDSINSNNSVVKLIENQTEKFVSINFEEIKKISGLNQQELRLLQQLEDLLVSNIKDLERYNKIESKIFRVTDFEWINKINKSSQNDLIKYLRGLYEVKKGNISEAEQVLKDFIKYAPANYKVISLLSEISYLTKNYTNSLKLYSYLSQAGISLNRNEMKMLNVSRVVNDTKFINQTISVNYYDIQPPVISEKINFENVNCKKISIIIPSKSRSNQLFDTLESLIYAAYNIDYEVILYLNDNVQFGKDEINKYHISKIYYDKEIFPDGKFSWTKLMNHGFNNASGEWIMYGSDDIVFHPFAFNYAFSYSVEESVGGINFLHRNTVEDYGGFYKKYGFDTLGMKPYINFGLIRKNAFLKTEGFCEKILFYSGDVDICHQILNKGYEIIPSYYSLVEHNNTTDKIRSEKSDKIYIDDTKTFVSRWANEISKFADNKIIKERYIIDDIYNFKRNIYLNCIRYNIPPEKLISIDKEYDEIHLTEKSKIRENSNIKVSAIVSVYNSGRFIKGCLEDLTSQSLFKKGMLEIVLVNCGDDKIDALEINRYKAKYSNISHIKLDKKVGIYKAWNIGIKAASGEYITNANTDDRHRNDALEIMLSVFDSNKDVDLVYADSYKTGKANDTYNSTTAKGLIKWLDYDSDLLLFDCYIGPQPMWKKSLHDKFGFFNEQLEVVGDYEFWLRISTEANFYHLNETLGLYYFSLSTAERTNQELTDRENLLIQNKYVSKYINTINKINMVYRKVLNHKGNNIEDNYYKLVTGLLEKRRYAISLEQEFISEIKKGFVNQKFDIEKIVNSLNQIIGLKNLSVNDDNIVAFFELYNAFIYKLYNDKSKVEKLLKKVYRINPIRFVAEYLGYDTTGFSPETIITKEELFVEINKLIESKKYKECADIVTNYLKTVTKLSDSVTNQEIEMLYNLLANIFILDCNYEKAHYYFSEELKINPGSARACLGLAQTFYEGELYHDSKSMFEWALKYEPFNKSAFEGLKGVNKKLNLNDFDYSLCEINNSTDYLSEAESLIEQNELDKAAEILMLMIHNNPADINALNNLAVIGIMKENYDEAAVVFERINAIDPKNEVAIGNMNYLQNLLQTQLNN